MFFFKNHIIFINAANDNKETLRVSYEDLSVTRH